MREIPRENVDSARKALRDIVLEIIKDYSDDPEEANKVIMDTFKKFAKDESQIIRYMATWELGSLENREGIIDDVIVLLLEIMNSDENQDVRERAGWVLLEMGEKAISAIPGLIEMLKTNPNSDVRGLSALILGDIGKSDIVPLLLSKIKKEENDSARSLIAWGLGRQGKKASVAVPILIDLMRNDDSVVVRWRCALALGLIGEKKATGALITSLEEDDDGDVRSSAANALGNLEAIEALQSLNKSLLNDKHEDTRFETTMAIGMMGEKAKISIPTLIQAMKKDESFRVRSMAVQMFPSMGTESKKAIPDLIEVLLNDEDDFVQEMTIRILGKLEAKEALEPIKFMMKKENFQCSDYELFLALTRIKGKESEWFQKLVEVKEQIELDEWALRDYNQLILKFDIEEKIEVLTKEILSLQQMFSDQIPPEMKTLFLDKINSMKSQVDEIIKTLPIEEKPMIPEKIGIRKLFDLRI